MSQLRDYIQKHPSEAQRLVGLDYAQLMELIGQAERLHNQKKLADEQKKTRIIKAGGGRQPKLSLSDQVLLTKRISTSLTDIPNVRGSIWGERISGKLYLSFLAENIKKLATSITGRTSKKTG
jgi:hypothetical protein